MGAYGNTPEASGPVISGYGSASGISAYLNQTPIPFANVSLYYQNEVAYGQTVKSGADGRFVFNNIPYGSYKVTVDKEFYRQNTSEVFDINSTSTDIGSIKVMHYDVSGDNNIDVIDLNMIAQRFSEKTGRSYPAVDVNGDGVVNVQDLNLVSGQIGG
jgi:hypothetical protein